MCSVALSCLHSRVAMRTLQMHQIHGESLIVKKHASAEHPFHVSEGRYMFKKVAFVQEVFFVQKVYFLKKVSFVGNERMSLHPHERMSLHPS